MLNPAQPVVTIFHRIPRMPQWEAPYSLLDEEGPGLEDRLYSFCINRLSPFLLAWADILDKPLAENSIICWVNRDIYPDKSFVGSDTRICLGEGLWAPLSDIEDPSSTIFPRYAFLIRKLASFIHTDEFRDVQRIEHLGLSLENAARDFPWGSSPLHEVGTSLVNVLYTLETLYRMFNRCGPLNTLINNWNPTPPYRESYYSCADVRCLNSPAGSEPLSYRSSCLLMGDLTTTITIAPRSLGTKWNTWNEHVAAGTISVLTNDPLDLSLPSDNPPPCFPLRAFVKSMPGSKIFYSGPTDVPAFSL